LFAAVMSSEDDLARRYLVALAIAARGLDEAARRERRGWAPIARRARAFVASEVSDVVAAAVELLGEIGEVTDLPLLNPLTEGFFRAGRIKDAARAAVARIKVRAQVRDEHGALSLAQGEAGDLSLSDDVPPSSSNT